MNTYTPTHRSGQTGPSFEFATLACLWILTQDEPSQWGLEGIL